MPSVTLTNVRGQSATATSLPELNHLLRRGFTPDSGSVTAAAAQFDPSVATQGQALEQYAVRRGSLRDLWRPRDTAGRRQLAATPPTVTLGADATTTISGSALIAPSDSRFTYLGADPMAYASRAGFYYNRQQYSGNPASVLGMYSVSFSFEGQAFEFLAFAFSSNMPTRIWVNGRPATAGFNVLGATDSTNRLVKVDLGSRDVYDIRIEIFNGLWGGVRVAATDMLFPALPKPPLRLMVLGDSYAVGLTAPPGYVLRLAELLGVEDAWAHGISGTGIITSNPANSGNNFRARIATDVIPYNPDVLLVQGSINDDGVAAGLLAAEIPVLYAQLAAALPNTLIVATGPLYAKAYTAAETAVNNESKAAWQALGVPFIDPAGWNTGTSNSASPNGSGTSDFNILSDNKHPTVIGHDYLAARIAAALGPIMRASALGTGIR